MKATTCRVEVCWEPVLARNLCKGHYSRWLRKGEDGLEAPLKYMSPRGTSKLPCAAEACGNTVGRGGRGLCVGHYERWRKTGNVQADKPLQRPRKRCLAPDCEALSSCRGYCNAHSQRIRRSGDAQVERPIAAKSKRMPGTDCQAPDCPRRRARKGLCTSHYRRWEREGEAGLTAPIRIAKNTEACVVDDCPDPVLAKGLCRPHYWRQWKTGDVRQGEPVRRPVARDEPCVVDRCTKTRARADKCSTHYQAAYMLGIKSDPERHEKYKAYQRRHNRDSRLRDPEGHRARVRAWRLANPAVYRAAYMRRKLRRMNAAHVPFSSEQLAAKMAYWGNRCWVCGGPFEAVDHVKPLSRGGAEILANLRPICTSDNSSKNGRWPWVPPAKISA